MTGGLLQLKAYGSENIYLNANPQISFFRSVYRRHTNFSMENFEINYIGTPNITEDTNTTFTFNINRYGDLLGPIFLVIRLPSIYSSENDKFQWIKNLGANIINSVTLFIAGQRICFINGETINNSYRLQKDYSTNLNYNELIGHSPTFYNPTMLNPNTNTITYKFSSSNPSIIGVNLYIPIPLYFTNNSGLYLPLIALQSAEVQIVVELKKICELYTIVETRKTNSLYNKRIKPNPNNNNHSILKFIKETSLKQAFQIHLDAQFIFLDNNERTQFAELPHEYLIEQIQYRRFFGINSHNILDLVFFHPTKEIRFFLRKTDNGVEFNQWSNYGNNDNYGEKYMEGSLNNFQYRSEMIINNIRQQMSENLSIASLNVLTDAKFLMNGQDRTNNLPFRYWNILQPFQYHLGSTVYPFDENDLFNIFSFSLEPDNFQPSGSCNLTNLKSFQLEINTVEPPLSKYLFLASYIITLSNNVFSNSWRNPVYNTNNSIDNVFRSLFEFYSLETTSINPKTIVDNQNIRIVFNEGIGRVYGTYIAYNNTKFNVKIEPVRYDILENGSMKDNKIMNGPNCRMQFYPITDIYFQTPLLQSTLTINTLELNFVYRDQPTTNEYVLQFVNINVLSNVYDTYNTNISQSEYNSLVNSLVQTTKLPYNTVYKSLESLLTEQITNILEDNSQRTNMFNSYVIVAVDFTNFKIYGTLLVNQIRYNTIFTFRNVQKDGNTYIIPLTGMICNIYPEDKLNFQSFDQINNFPQQFLPYSIIIFTMIPLNNNNPDNLKNYLWNYDLFVEAHNYNLLRISNGTGAVAYST